LLAIAFLDSVLVPIPGGVDAVLLVLSASRPAWMLIYVAAATIGAADMFGLPVSTTHVLSSGVAGAMAANGSGLQIATIRNMVMAWVLTLPAAILISGALYVIFSRLF